MTLETRNQVRDGNEMVQNTGMQALFSGSLSRHPRARCCILTGSG